MPMAYVARLMTSPRPIVLVGNEAREPHLVPWARLAFSGRVAPRLFLMVHILHLLTDVFIM